METTQSRLNEELSKGKSIAWWAVGYYVAVGNEHCPSLKVPIFQHIEESKTNSIVLIDYLGSMMFINVRPEQVFYGWGITESPSKEGKLLRYQLEAFKV